MGIGVKLSTWNINGLRSGFRSGLVNWLSESKPDVVCLQEVKTEEDLLGGLWFPGYNAHWFGALKPGYSGVVTLVSADLSPVAINRGIGVTDIDAEGRVLAVEFANFTVVNVYAPHSHRQLKRLDFKLYFLEQLGAYIRQLTAKRKPFVIVGDLNIAYDDRDVANFSSNRKNAGFLPQEREWLDRMYQLGLQDAFRLFCQDAGHYTWWSPITGVRDRNVGWRLDYILVDQGMSGHLRSCYHSPEQRGSDHCPVTAEFSFL